MIDLRFAASALLAAVVPFLIARRAARHDEDVDYVLDVGFSAVVAGLVVARVVAVALDDPTGLGDLKSMLSVRGGVELWAGAAAGTAVVALRATRSGRSVWTVLACGAPLALWAYATWEAGCALRDGCFGPASPVGLVPPGLTQRVLPLGLLMAATVAGVGAAAWRWRHRAPMHAVVGSVAGFAIVRAVASFWLPALGDGLTRPHRESLVVAVLAVFAFVGTCLRHPLAAVAPPTQPLAPPDP